MPEQLLLSPDKSPLPLEALEVIGQVHNTNDHKVAIEYGLVPTEDGPLFTWLYPDHSSSYIDQQGRYYTDSEPVCRELHVLVYTIDNKLLASGMSGVATALGYTSRKLEREDNIDMEVYTLPTAEYLNSALSTIYHPSGKKPPLEFVEVDGRYGRSSGKDFIENLAERKVTIAPPSRVGAVEHDHIAHVLGYVSFSATIMGAVGLRARQLVDEGKLTTHDDGTLSDQEARDFAYAVDSLSGLLNDYYTEHTTPESYVLDSPIRTILNPAKNNIPTAAKVVKIRRDLVRHRFWLRKQTERA